jgi:hypothetical protein
MKRASPLDVIYVPVMVADTTIMKGGQLLADLDTGNDHTCIRRDVLETIGIPIVGRPMPVHGVTGSATGTVVTLFLGFEMDDGHKCNIEGHEVVVLDTMTTQCLLGRDTLCIFDVELRTDGTTILKFG